MSSLQHDRNSGKVCPSCFNVLLIFDFCLECDVDCVKCFCDKEFTTFQYFKDHVERHDEFRNDGIRAEIKLRQRTDAREVFVCVSCKSTFVDRKRLMIHIRSVHAIAKLFMCSHCHRYYSTKLTLQRHIVNHTQQPGYNCHLCSKSYFKFSNLKYHLQSHMNEKAFKCGLCDKAFNDKYSLSRHLKLHDTEKLYKCDECGKLFMFHFTLKRHKLTHSRTDNFVCDICKKSYKWKVDLKRHIMKHVQGKVYPCSVCKKTFARKSYAIEHKLTHSAAKMRMCFCGKTFKFLSGLSKHRATHKLSVDTNENKTGREER